MRRLRWPKTRPGRTALTRERWDRWRYLPRLLGLLWSVGRRDMTVLLTLSLVSGLMPLLSVAVLQALVDSAVAAVQHTTSVRTVGMWALALFLANTAGHIGMAAQRWLGDDIQERLKARVQERVLHTATHLPLAVFEQPAFYDQLHRAQRSLDTRLFTTMQQLVPIPTTLVTMLSLFIYLSVAHVLLPVVLMVGLLPLVLKSTHSFVKRYLLERHHSAAERMVRYLSTLLTERSAAAEVRLFDLRTYLLAAWQQRYTALRTDRLTLARDEAAMLVGRTVMERLIVGVALSGVIGLIALGRVSLGYFASYLSAVDQFTGALYTFLWGVASTDNDLRYIQDLLDYLDRAQHAGAEHETQDEVLPPPGHDSLTIQLENVSFTYPGMDRPALNGITVTLQPGERIALVGENGSGKTTLAKILLGLYAPTSGRMTINGVNVTELDPHWWRTQVAAVFQDYVKFEVTARENIGFGDVAQLSDDNGVVQAAQQSGADAMIMTLPHAYETVPGKAFDETGVDLSGGQWQKLAIARAYRRRAALVVLDEPTAALDARAEVEVYRQFRDAAVGRSALLISHRLGSARLADRIVVLEQGQIVESGTHAALVKAGGRYAEMYHVQAAWYH